MTELSADSPSIDPKDDLFGHAPFAKSLADGIGRYPGRDGLVLALYGPWGSGTSTALNYMRHFLGQKPEPERPAILTFNPWWFSGRTTSLAPSWDSYRRCCRPRMRNSGNWVIFSEILPTGSS